MLLVKNDWNWDLYRIFVCVCVCSNRANLCGYLIHYGCYQITIFVWKWISFVHGMHMWKFNQGITVVSMKHIFDHWYSFNMYQFDIIDAFVRSIVCVCMCILYCSRFCCRYCCCRCCWCCCCSYHHCYYQYFSVCLYIIDNICSVVFQYRIESLLFLPTKTITREAITVCIKYQVKKVTITTNSPEN